MNTQLMDTIKDALEDVTKITPEKLQAMVQETIAAFQTIQAKVSSEDGAERAEGMRVAAELKAAMEDQVQSIQKKLGMTAEEMAELRVNPDVLNAQLQ